MDIADSHCLGTAFLEILLLVLALQFDEDSLYHIEQNYDGDGISGTYCKNTGNIYNNEQMDSNYEQEQWL